jgi:hypothetical protein
MFYSKYRTILPMRNLFLLQIFDLSSSSSKELRASRCLSVKTFRHDLVYDITEGDVVENRCVSSNGIKRLIKVKNTGRLYDSQDFELYCNSWLHKQKLKQVLALKQG